MGDLYFRNYFLSCFLDVSPLASVQLVMGEPHNPVRNSHFCFDITSMKALEIYVVNDRCCTERRKKQRSTKQAP